MHDVRTVVSQLRDHLAAHDRPLAFLFGAGTSVAVTATTGGPLVPAIAGMTLACQHAVEACGANEKAAWAKLTQECVDLKQSANIESVLGRIRAKLDALTGADTIGGLTRDQWSSLDSTVRKEIVRLADPDPASIPARLPHHDFARWIRNTTRRQPVEVFTTNYDILFERTFDELRVPHFDGFVGSQHPYFASESVEDDQLLPPPSWVRYWKIHGSVSWSLETISGESRITRTNKCGDGELILPSHRKYDESRKEPYRSLMDRLSRVLGRTDSLLIVCGYSFGDQHINAIILDALEQHPRTHLLALSYGDVSNTGVIAEWAASHPNVMQVARNGGILSGKFGEWSATGKIDSALTEATGGLVCPDPADAAKPCVHAGDFGAFSAFLGGFHRGRP